MLAVKRKRSTRRALPFMWVDAFTSRPFAGNPCAVILDADGLSDERMLAIAREMNLSETAFVVRSKIADIGARYFTPEREIPLAGHPTIATLYALVASGRMKPDKAKTLIKLELRAGVVTVEIGCRDGRAELVTMSQKKPRFMATIDGSQVLPLFGLTSRDLAPGVPIQVVSTGTPQLMIPLRTLAALRRVKMDIPAYKKLRAKMGFFSPHLFCCRGATPRGHTFARHLGVPPDTAEDPFTGSATGGMAAYLWRYRLISKPTFIAEQGHWMNRPGQAAVEVIGPPTAIETVKVGGTATIVLQGEIFVPNRGTPIDV